MDQIQKLEKRILDLEKQISDLHEEHNFIFRVIVGIYEGILRILHKFDKSSALVEAIDLLASFHRRRGSLADFKRDKRLHELFRGRAGKWSFFLASGHTGESPHEEQQIPDLYEDHDLIIMGIVAINRGICEILDKYKKSPAHTRDTALLESIDDRTEEIADLAREERDARFKREHNL